LGGNTFPRDESEPYPQKQLEYCTTLLHATQRHRNKITAGWKQPPLLRTEHQRMVKKMVKKRKRAKEGCEKKPPN